MECAKAKGEGMRNLMVFGSRIQAKDHGLRTVQRRCVVWEWEYLKRPGVDIF